MKLLIYGINYAPELTGVGKYTGEMAPLFATQGHSVRVITAPPYYPNWQVQPGYRKLGWQHTLEANVCVTRCPLYVPHRPTSLRRLLHLGSFALSSFYPLLVQWRWKPDVILLVAPTLFCAPAALLLAKLSGGRCVLHIQDYEVDALFGLSLGSDMGLSETGRLKRFSLACERWLLRRFDRVSTISTGMLRRAEQKGVAPERLILFPNWSEIGHFRDACPSLALMQELGVPAGRRVLLYSGNIGEKQGLEMVLDAALALQGRPELFFLIVGDGAGKARLVARAAELGLDNLAFAPLQSWDALPTLLASADVHLVIQKRGAADAVLPSKLTNILAVGGNSIISADPDTSLGELCANYPGIATRVEPESLDALLAGIEQSLDYPRPNPVARTYAEHHLDKETILREFQAKLLVLEDGGG
jgi:colanic acid biosynthesis glycosyl transferase WcaI